MKLGVHCSIKFGTFEITIESFSYTLTVYLDYFLPASAGRLRKLLKMIEANCELNDASYTDICYFLIEGIRQRFREAPTAQDMKKLAQNEKLLKGEIEKWLL